MPIRNGPNGIVPGNGPTKGRRSNAMSNREEDLIPLVIAAAHAAAGKGAKNSDVVELIPSIAASMSEGSREWKAAAEVLGAAMFTATFVGFEVEDSSKRCLVQLNTGRPSKNYPDGIEPIRSHRTDNPQGRAMQRKLAALKPGDRVLIWKAMDEIADGQKARLLAHIQWIGHAEESKPLQRQPDTSGQGGDVEVVGDRKPESSRPPANLGTLDDDGVEYAAEQFNDLGPKDKAACVKLFRERGISFPVPTSEDVNKFLAVIGQVTNT
jgi:hypothetical protein